MVSSIYMEINLTKSTEFLKMSVEKFLRSKEKLQKVMGQCRNENNIIFHKNIGQWVN